MHKAEYAQENETYKFFMILKYKRITQSDPKDQN